MRAGRAEARKTETQTTDLDVGDHSKKAAFDSAHANRSTRTQSTHILTYFTLA